MTIRTRYTLLTTALISAVVAAVAATVTGAHRSVLESQARERLAAVSGGVSRLAQESIEGRDPVMLISYLIYLRRDRPELAYASVTRQGHTWTLGETRPGLIYWTGAVRARHPVTVTLKGYAAGAGPAVDLRVSSAGVNVNVPGDAVVAVTEGPSSVLDVRLGYDAAMIDAQIARALRPIARRTLAVSGFFMILGWLATFSLGKHLTGPLLALSATVTRAKNGDLAAAADASASDEVGALGANFNDMTSRIRGLLRDREDILHTLSHELNTPLGGLKGYLELWAERGVPQDGPDRREALGTMLAAVLRMEGSLAGALDLFRGEAGGDQSARTLVWVDTLLRELCALFAPISTAKRITIALPPLSEPTCVWAHKFLLVRVAANLISNALKYTPDGGRIRLTLRTDPDVVVLQVADTGYGIAPEDVPHLFAKFFRSQPESGERRRIPGSGLGLSIAAKAARELGGRISVHSVLRRGTIFTVVIPRVPPLKWERK